MRLSMWAVLSVCFLPAGAWGEERSISYNFQATLPGLPASGDWSTVENWSPFICLQYNDTGGCVTKGYPGQQPADATEHVFYRAAVSNNQPLGGTAALDVNVTDASISELKVGTDVEVNVGVLGLNKWDLTAPTLTWKTAPLINSGVVNVGSLLFSNGYMSLEGSGKVVLQGGTLRANLNNASRIEGMGIITSISSKELLTFSNSGVIDANINAGAIAISNLPSVAYNAGSLRASNGGILRLQGGAGIVLNNNLGTIEALDNSLVELNSAWDVRGGTLATSGSGRIEVRSYDVNFSNTTINGLIQVNNGQRLSFGVGADTTITNNGTVRLDSTGSETVLRMGSNVALGGSGRVLLNHSTRSIVTGYTTGSLVNGPDHAIAGAGQILNMSSFVNHGLVDANLAGGTLRLTNVSSVVANSGLMRATSGATLEITNLNPYTLLQFNNTAGDIHAGDGSLVTLQWVRLSGGSLSTSGSGVIRLPTSATEIGGLENLGTLDVRGSTTIIPGTLANHGQILVGAGSSAASLNIQGNVTFGGGGVITLSNTASNEISSAGGASQMVNGSGHTIQGSGRIGGYGLAVVNNGTLLANQSAAMTLAPSGYVNSSLNNNGTLRVSAGSALTVQQNLLNYNATTQTLSGGTYDVQGTLRLPVGGGIVRNAANIILDGAGANLYNGTSGTVSALAALAENEASGAFTLKNGRNFTTTNSFGNAGDIKVGAGSTFAVGGIGLYGQTAGSTQVDGTLQASTVVLQGGVLTGSGNINGALINGGQINPGNSPGVLTISGNYTQSASGVYAVEIGGLSAGTGYDVLNVFGTATLDGTLDIRLSDLGSGLFAPKAGDSFDILTAELIQGSFGTLTYAMMLDPGLSWHVDYLTDVIGTTDLVRLSVQASPVPVPAAAWLFGSGLLGLIGVARCKRD